MRATQKSTQERWKLNTERKIKITKQITAWPELFQSNILQMFSHFINYILQDSVQMGFN